MQAIITMLTFFSENFSEKRPYLIISFSLTKELILLAVFFSIPTFVYNKELAFRLNKSIATVPERIRRLKEQGYIVLSETKRDTVYPLYFF